MVFKTEKGTCMRDRIENMKRIGSAILITFILFIAPVTGGDTDNNREQTDRKTYALVVSGISKELQDNMNMTKTITELQ